jgi:hypothetical protein
MCVNEECTIGLYDEGWDGGACVWEEMDLDILKDEFIKYVEKYVEKW